MPNFTLEELKSAHRASLSLRNKSDKASGKLKQESWQYKLMRSNVTACGLVLQLLDGKAVAVSREELDEAHKTLSYAVSRTEEVTGKFAEGSPQHTLLKNRLAALKLALPLIERKQNAL